ncbi:MAG: hypothetical protein ACE5GE_10415, partial [Phycisphaerae bacterium]
DIVVTQMEDVLAVPVQAVFTKSGHHFVFRQRRGDPAPVEVHVGHSSDEFAEVRDGLQAGDRVLLAVSDSVRQSLPEVQPKAGSAKDRAAKAKGARPRPGGKRPPGQYGKGRPAGKHKKAATGHAH